MGSEPCRCISPRHAPRLVVLTGGPGAGKTAVLEIVRRNFCDHVAVLPEAAGIVFGGGFPRKATLAGRRAGQRAIFRIQRELERLAVEEARAAVVLCDRGTLDGLAYWPLEDASFFEENGTSLGAELQRYAAVIHLHTPPSSNGYDHSNPLRIESALEAGAIDQRIVAAWAGHPRRHFVESTTTFLDKVTSALDKIRREVPVCCRSHRIAEVNKSPSPQSNFERAIL